MSVKGCKKVADHYGGQAALARILGVSQQAVSAYVLRGHFPDDWVLALMGECPINTAEYIRPEVMEIIRKLARKTK